MSDLLSQLNEPQRQAAACTEGPVMIIAGAGSGKTRTLTYRIAHLIELGVDPFNILALTFTNKAAAEMKDRIIKLVGAEARNIWMGTFHSIFARILRSEATKIGYVSSFTIYDTDDCKSTIKQILKNLNLDPKIYNPTFVLSRISMAKSNLLSPEDYANNPETQQSDITAHKPLIKDIYKIYNQRLRSAMAMDFDDLLFNTNVLLRDFPEVLLKYQNRFRYILVDEYQDTNYSQYLIVKKLAARFQNLCVVGDDAQSIYAFRGANIQNIFNFKRDYPNLSLFKLEQNYRSTQNIVNAANSIIAQNKEQIPKDIWTDNAAGNLIKVIQAADERDEAQQVTDSIMQIHLGDDAGAYGDCAILYRTNAQSRAIEESLRRRSIPYHIYQGLSFYGRKEIKDVLAYLRLVVNNHDDESLNRIINYPPRGIGQTTMDKIQLAATDNAISLWTVIENIGDFGLGISSATINRINEFVTMIKRHSAASYDTDAYTVAKQILNATGIIPMLQADPDPDNPNRIENIEELLNGVQEFCQTPDDITPQEVDEPPLKTLDQFLQQVLLLTSEDKDKEGSTDKVSLMTIHAAKGLEFPYVYIVGMEENLFPSALSIASRQELEEERRLFYVAVTRAERQVTLSYALNRYQYGKSSFQEISRFIEEIDPRYIQLPSSKKRFPPVGKLPLRRVATPTGPTPSAPRTFTPIAKTTAPAHAAPSNNAELQVGAIVAHPKFGTGTVISIEGTADSRKAIVRFQTVGDKQLLLKFAKLTILSES